MRNVEASVEAEGDTGSRPNSPAKGKGKRKVEVEIVSRSAKKQRTQEYDRKDPSPLGFVASKRTVRAAHPKDKDRDVTPSRPSDRVPHPSPLKTQSSYKPSLAENQPQSKLNEPPLLSRRSPKSKTTSPKPNVPPRTTGSIAALPEDQFLPPSFPSNLDTSTPPDNNKRRPEPIRSSMAMVSSPMVVDGSSADISVALAKGKSKQPLSPQSNLRAKRARIDDEDGGDGKMTDLRELLSSARTPSPKKRTPSKAHSTPSPSKDSPNKSSPSRVPFRASVSKSPSKQNTASKLPQARQQSEPHVDLDIASPAKSLSSIAGDDTDEEEEEAPVYAATQLRGAYDSQFDLEGGVDDLQGFLERDVSMVGEESQAAGGKKQTEEKDEEEVDDDDEVEEEEFGKWSTLR